MTMLGNLKEIVFDKKKFIIRIPTIYDNHVYKISIDKERKTPQGKFLFSGKGVGTVYMDHTEIVGYYLLEKEGDDFVLTKQD